MATKDTLMSPLQLLAGELYARQARAKAGQETPTASELLRRALPYVEESAKEVMGYGNFPGGDPRNFCPDDDGTTDEERAQWVADCAAAEKDEQGARDRVAACQWVAGDTLPSDVIAAIRETQEKRGQEPTGPGPIVHLTRAKYGLGTYRYHDEEAVKLLVDMKKMLGQE